VLYKLARILLIRTFEHINQIREQKALPKKDLKWDLELTQILRQWLLTQVHW